MGGKAIKKLVASRGNRGGESKWNDILIQFERKRIRRERKREPITITF